MFLLFQAGAMPRFPYHLGERCACRGLSGTRHHFGVELRAGVASQVAELCMVFMSSNGSEDLDLADVVEYGEWASRQASDFGVLPCVRWPAQNVSQSSI